MTDDGVQTRAHLETQLASTLALKSPSEYRQCLLSYIRFLARSVSDLHLGVDSRFLDCCCSMSSCSFPYYLKDLICRGNLTVRNPPERIKRIHAANTKKINWDTGFVASAVEEIFQIAKDFEF